MQTAQASPGPFASEDRYRRSKPAAPLSKSSTLIHSRPSTWSASTLAQYWIGRVAQYWIGADIHDCAGDMGISPYGEDYLVSRYHPVMVIQMVTLVSTLRKVAW